MFLGPAGRITKEKKYAYNVGISFNNDLTRKRFEEVKEQITNDIDKHPGLSQMGCKRPGGGSKSLNKNVLKEVLLKHLYNDDPSFDSYDIYPEVKKPIHVERAHHAKPLIEPTYIPEPVKQIKEETTIKHTPLF